MEDMASVLDGEQVQGLSALIEESTRSSREGTRFFIEPATNTLARALAKRHHLVFGRRGSGKSSLLNKVLVDAQADRRPIVYIDMEAFKGHTYPDVLVSVLLSTFQEFRRWIDGVAVQPGTKMSFWQKLIGRRPNRGPLKDSRLDSLRSELDSVITSLQELLHEADESTRHLTNEDLTASQTETSLSANIGNEALGARAGQTAGGSNSTRRVQSEEYVHKKIAYLHREILRFKELLKRICDIGGSYGYILLDDLYHIRSDDQVDVIDYFHRIAKGTEVWLKIGTIRHRTSHYAPGDPPRGMKIGDDCDEIDLDVTLERYQLTKSFLTKIMEQFARECNVLLGQILTDGARDRLVIGSGGVARDFLTIFRRSIDIAKERYAAGDRARGDKIGAEDVNKAAGENDSYKQSDFVRDTAVDEQETLRTFFQRIVDFCVTGNKTNCFLIEKDTKSREADLVAELVDLKFLHHCNSRVTVRSKKGKIYEAYMLDIAQYTGERARRNLDIIEFWARRGEEKLRKASLIFLER